ncbi:MAG TPA: hypothetical protein VFM08_04015 [Nocardioides sp.]|jgi:hypothetical protein|nr:hypothetical protein [Nocardioides sp.]
MRRTLGTLLAALALAVTAGCGDSSSTAQDPGQGSSSGTTGSPSRTPGAVEGATVLPLISLTGAGGQPQRTATLLESEADVKVFSRTLRIPQMWRRIDAEVRDVLGKPGQQVYAQVVMVGCDHPPGADVVANAEGDIVLVAREVASPLEECLVPVTTVAVAVVPET